jgi:hypothetical protein
MKVGFRVSRKGKARMTEDSADFIAKLRQIEEQVNVINAELPHNPLRTRLQHMAILAKALRGRLELGVVSIVRAAPGAPPTDERESSPA